MVCDIRIDKGKKKTDGKGCAYVQPFVLTGITEETPGCPGQGCTGNICGRTHPAAGHSEGYMTSYMTICRALP